MAEDNKETQLFGRRVLYANYDESDLSEDVIQQILNRVFPIHMRNVSEIEYLENYYRGMQPILKKVKIFFNHNNFCHIYYVIMQI